MGVIDNNTLVYIRFDGEPFVDSSFYERSLAVNYGNPSSVTTGVFDYAGYFTDDRLIVDEYVPEFNFRGGDWTIDFWCKKNSGGYCHPVTLRDSSNNGITIYDSDEWGCTITGIITAEVITYGINYSEFTHLALVRHSNELQAYTNGERTFTKDIGSSVMSQLNSTARLTIGKGIYGNTDGIDAYFCEFRVSDVARWTENFTPPSRPYSPYRASGTLSDPSRVIIINESDWTLEASEEKSSGPYIIGTKDLDPKTIIAVKSDGEGLAYTGIIPE